MRLLSFLNVSNMSNLEADSGYVFQRTILDILASWEHDVSLVGPPNMPNLSPNIHPIAINFSDSKFGVRMGLEWNEVKKALSKEDPFDIALINQSELTAPLKLLFYEVWGEEIPCVTYYHYLAIEGVKEGKIQFDPSQNLFNMGNIIWQRQIDSAKVSDASIIGSEFGRNLFLQASGLKQSDINLEVIPPPVQDYEQDPFFYCGQRGNGKPTLFYNHRLYSHYGGDEIFRYLEELNNEIPFTLIVTDPTGNRSPTREKLDSSVSDVRKYLKGLDFVKIQNFKTQEDYYRALASVDIGIGHLRNGALWSMAIADIMSLGKPVIGLNNGAIPEVIGDSDLIFSNKEEFKSIIKKLLTDPTFLQAKQRFAKEKSRNLLPKAIAGKFENVLLNVIKNKVQHEYSRN